jgi:hypothetical protein
MSKILIISIIGLFFGQPLSSQVTFKTYLGGAISSPSISFLEGTDKDLKEKLEELYGSISSPYLGIQFQKRISNHISFNIDLQSCIKGQKVSDKDDFYYKAVYIDLMPNVDINLWRNLKIGAGPYVSSKIADLSKTSVISNGLWRKNLDYGLGASLTIEINKFSFRLSYLYGLYETFIGPIDRYKHRILQLGIGYSIYRN